MGHHDLGIHTEMLSDGVKELVEAGVVTGRRKTVLPGKMVASFLMGSTALYQWVRLPRSDSPSDSPQRPGERPGNHCPESTGW